MSRKSAALLIAGALYIGAYVVFRQLNSQVWERDQRSYVIFPAGYGTVLYYLWRPLSYVDGGLTGMQFHIGPHR